MTNQVKHDDIWQLLEDLLSRGCQDIETHLHQTAMMILFSILTYFLTYKMYKLTKTADMRAFPPVNLNHYKEEQEAELAALLLNDADDEGDGGMPPPQAKRLLRRGTRNRQRSFFTQSCDPY